jgi:hypothetical protein
VPRLTPAWERPRRAASRKEAGDVGNVVVLRQLGLLQDTGDEDLQMLERGVHLELPWAGDQSHPGGVQTG